MSNLNCDQFINKCNGGCCGVIPMSTDLVLFHEDKAAVDFEMSEIGTIGILGEKPVHHSIPQTKDGYCIFLDREDYSCRIYYDRPAICKKFGDESSAMMSCPFQDKCGKARSEDQIKILKRRQEWGIMSTMEMRINKE